MDGWRRNASLLWLNIRRQARLIFSFFGKGRGEKAGVKKYEGGTANTTTLFSLQIPHGSS